MQLSMKAISQRAQRRHKEHRDSLNLCGHCDPRKEHLIERGVPKVGKSLQLNQRVLNMMASDIFCFETTVSVFKAKKKLNCFNSYNAFVSLIYRKKLNCIPNPCVVTIIFNYFYTLIFTNRNK